MALPWWQHHKRCLGYYIIIMLSEIWEIAEALYLEAIWSFWCSPNSVSAQKATLCCVCNVQFIVEGVLGCYVMCSLLWKVCLGVTWCAVYCGRCARVLRDVQFIVEGVLGCYVMCSMCGWCARCFLMNIICRHWTVFFMRVPTCIKTLMSRTSSLLWLTGLCPDCCGYWALISVTVI